MDIINILSIILYAIPGLILIIVVHELGHLFLARAGGIKVEAFSLFFGKPIFKFNWKGIEWRIAWLPFGGYCKMKGHDDLGNIEIKKDPDEFYSRPAWARFMAILGGPLFNVIFAYLLFLVLMSFKQTQFPNSEILVHPDKDKYQIPFQDGDKIIELNGERIESWNHLNDRFLQSFLYQDEQKLIVKRDTELLMLKYSAHPDQLMRKMALGFMLPELLFVDEIPNKLSIGKNEEAKPIFILNPVQNYFQKGDIILSVDEKIVSSIEHLKFFLNQESKDGKLERKILFLSFPKPLEANAEILELNGKRFHFLSELETQILNPEIKNYEVRYQVNGKVQIQTLQKKEIYIKPVQRKFYNEKTQKFEYQNILGLQFRRQLSPQFLFGKNEYYYSFPQVFQKASLKLWDTILLSIYQFRLLFNMSFENVREGLSGPIGVVEVLGKAANYNWQLYLNIIAILSVVLGIINLLPIPALDGGHLFLTFIEMILRRPLNIKVVQVIQWIGILIIISFALLITFNDILKLISRL